MNLGIQNMEPAFDFNIQPTVKNPRMPASSPFLKWVY